MTIKRWVFITSPDLFSEADLKMVGNVRVNTRYLNITLMDSSTVGVNNLVTLMSVILCL